MSYNYAPKGVPNPFVPFKHNWKGGPLNEGSLFHGPIYTRPVYTLPWKKRPYDFAAPPLSGMGAVEVNTRGGSFANEGYGGGLFNLNTAFGGVHKYGDISDLNAPYDQAALQGLGAGSISSGSMGSLGEYKVPAKCLQISEDIADMQRNIGELMKEQVARKQIMTQIVNELASLNEEIKDPGLSPLHRSVLQGAQTQLNIKYAGEKERVTEIDLEVKALQDKISQAQGALVACKKPVTVTAPVKAKVVEKPVIEPTLTISKSKFPWELVVAGGIAAALTGGLWYYSQQK